MELSTTNVVTVNKNVFQLMKLPLELRIMIYKLSLDYNSGTFNTICQWVHAYSDVVHVVLRRLHRAQSLCYSVFRDDSRCWPETYLPKFNTPTCLLISKTVHAEALPELRKQPFVFGPDFGHLSLQCSEIISPAFSGLSRADSLQRDYLSRVEGDDEWTSRVWIEEVGG